jgi:hypothetical protein
MNLDFIKFPLTIQKYGKERRAGITTLVHELLHQLSAYTHEQWVTQHSEGGQGKCGVE